MKHIFLCSIAVLAFACNSNEKTETTESNKRQSLGKIRWIEGYWRGIYEGNPFYEMYRIANDSTLEIVSYNWNQKDSTVTNRSIVKWINNNYYLGDSLNWKVTRITDTSIYMEANYKAFNGILWKKVDPDHWDAILTTKKGEIIYNMERVKTLSH